MGRVHDDGAFAEIAKYSVKPFDFTADDETRLFVYETLRFALKGRRLVQTYGVIKTALKGADLNEVDEEVGSGRGAPAYRFRWSETDCKYLEIEC